MRRIIVATIAGPHREDEGHPVAEQTIGIIMNGASGRMGYRQHLVRSILAIREQGGVELADGTKVQVEPLLVGRSEAKLAELAARPGIEHYTTDLDAALADDRWQIYADFLVTKARFPAIKKAIAAGKAIYTEKPTAESFEDALELARLAEEAGVKNGVVHDKLYLPGLRKLKRLIDSGFFGQILSVRGEFGYWVFEGDTVPAQRPSWNYRKEDGGGMIIDMLCHWRYVLDNIFGPVRSVMCRGATHIKERVDETGKPYTCTADDAAYAMFEIDGPEGEIVVNFNCSWATRVRRDDLLTLHVDGELGSAVAGLRKCHLQHYGNTPKPVWNPDIDQPINFLDDWAEVPDQELYDNAFKVQWEMFLKHVVLDTPFRWTLLEGAKGVQLAEKGLDSWEKRAWVELEDLKA